MVLSLSLSLSFFLSFFLIVLCFCIYSNIAMMWFILCRMYYAVIMDDFWLSFFLFDVGFVFVFVLL
jgi:hypothetical protein